MLLPSSRVTPVDAQRCWGSTVPSEHFPGMRDAGAISVRFVPQAAVQQALGQLVTGKEVGWRPVAGR
jgi:hypothetical protein